MNYTLIIPTLNEVENLKIILPAVSSLTNDIVVIDAGTDDETERMCQLYGIRYYKQKSKGKGNALVEAVNYAVNDVVCFFDADLAHDPASIPHIVKPILSGDVVHVSGSRMLGGSSELFSDLDHSIRLIGSLIINYAISCKFGIRMTDCQNGFRALKKDFFKSLDINSNHTTIEQELVGKTLEKGEIILEIPTHEYSRIAGKSKINVIKHGPSYVISLIGIMNLKKKKIDKNEIKKVRNKYTYNWWETN